MKELEAADDMLEKSMDMKSEVEKLRKRVIKEVKQREEEEKKKVEEAARKKEKRKI